MAEGMGVAAEQEQHQHPMSRVIGHSQLLAGLQAMCQHCSSQPPCAPTVPAPCLPASPHDSAARLDGLNDLGGLVAGQCKPRGGAVDLHGAPQRLLRRRRHAAGQGGAGVGAAGCGGNATMDGAFSIGIATAMCKMLEQFAFSLPPAWRQHVLGPAPPVRLIQDDDLLAPRRQRHLLLRKHLDLVAHLPGRREGGACERGGHPCQQCQCPVNGNNTIATSGSHHPEHHNTPSNRATASSTPPLARTTSMPRSSEAFSSSTASRKLGPSSSCARHRMLVVFPVPGGPCSQQRQGGREALFACLWSGFRVTCATLQLMNADQQHTRPIAHYQTQMCPAQMSVPTHCQDDVGHVALLSNNLRRKQIQRERQVLRQEQV